MDGSLAILVGVLGIGSPTAEGPAPGPTPALAAAREDAWYRKHARLEAQLAFSGVGAAFGAALAGTAAFASEPGARAGFATIGLSTFALGVTGLGVAGARLRAHRVRRPPPSRDARWIGRRLSLHRNMISFGAVSVANVAVVVGSYALGSFSGGSPDEAPDAVGPDIAFYPAVAVAASAAAVVCAVGLALYGHRVRREFTPLRVRASAPGLAVQF